MTSDGKPCTAATVILRTKGCHWWWSSGCTFCGYFNDTRDDVTNENLHAQWEHAKKKLNNFEGMDMVKVYTSGSLLEDREIPVEFQQAVLSECHELERVDCRIKVRAIDRRKTTMGNQHKSKIHCCNRLPEAYDDEVLKFHVNKGFTTKSFDKSG